MRQILEDAEGQWTTGLTMDRLWTMESLILASDGTLSKHAQTTCLSRMLPANISKLLRAGTTTDTVRSEDLWLTREASGAVREARPGEGPPTWILTQRSAQLHR